MHVQTSNYIKFHWKIPEIEVSGTVRYSVCVCVCVCVGVGVCMCVCVGGVGRGEMELVIRRKTLLLCERNIGCIVGEKQRQV